MTISVYYISDLHLEYLPDMPDVSQFVPVATDSILILAGDIGQPSEKLTKFLAAVRSRFSAVIYVPGNHEYWSVDDPEVIEIKLRELCRRLDIVYLNRGMVTINDRICILGTTLWSYIPSSMYDVMTEYLHDNRNIKGWSPARATAEFKCNYNWLMTQLTACREKYCQVIVVTHHAPLIHETSKPQYQHDPRNCGYSSDCSELVKLADYWIFGHTHYSVDLKFHGCRVLANQKGRLEELDTGFKVAKHFHC